MRVIRQLTTLMLVVSAVVYVQAVLITDTGPGNLDGWAEPLIVQNTYTFTNGNYARGYVFFEQSFTLTHSGVTVNFNITGGGVQGKLGLNGGTLNLQNDLEVFGSRGTILKPATIRNFYDGVWLDEKGGTIIGNSYTLYLSGGALTQYGVLKTFNDTRIDLRDGSLFLTDNVTTGLWGSKVGFLVNTRLTLRNGTIIGINDTSGTNSAVPTIRFVYNPTQVLDSDGTSLLSPFNQLTLERMTLVFDQTYTFSRAALQCLDSVKFIQGASYVGSFGIPQYNLGFGNLTQATLNISPDVPVGLLFNDFFFNWASLQLGNFITENYRGELYIGPSIIFNYSPAQYLIESDFPISFGSIGFLSRASVLHLDGCVFTSTVPLDLRRGKMIIDGNVNFYSYAPKDSFQLIMQEGLPPLAAPGQPSQDFVLIINPGAKVNLNNINFQYNSPR